MGSQNIKIGIQDECTNPITRLFSVKTTLQISDYGKVYVVQFKEDNSKLRLVREIQLKKLFPAEGPETLKAIEDVSENFNRHSYFSAVRIFQVFKESNVLYCLTEHCSGGNLEQYLEQCKGHFILNEDQITTWFAQIALAVNYFLDQQLAHSDITAQNIYLKPTEGNGYVLKIGDSTIRWLKLFHNSYRKQNDEVNQLVDLFAIKSSAVSYLAPEVLSKSSSGGEKEDIWSLGVILFQLATLTLPFKETSIDGILRRIKGQQRDVSISSSKYSKELRLLVDEMLTVEKNNRPTIKSVLKNKFCNEAVIKSGGGRGWSAYQHELEKKRLELEQLQLKEKIKMEISQKNSLNQNIIFEQDYLRCLTGPVVESPWFSAKSTIVDVAINDARIAIVVCNDGAIYALENNPDSLKARQLWKGVIIAPTSATAKTTVAHAAVEIPSKKTKSLKIYFTIIEDRSGIFTANLNQISQNFILNDSRPVCAEFFVRGSLENRGFSALAVVTSAGILFCCDESANFDVAVYSLSRKKLISRISHPKVRPLKCAAFHDEASRSVILSVADTLASSVLIFKVNLNNYSANLVASLNVGRQSRGMSFDPTGSTLFVADESESCVKIFSKSKKWNPAGTIVLCLPSYLRMKIPAVGVCLEDPSDITQPERFIPFLFVAFSWQQQILGYFQAPEVR